MSSWEEEEEEGNFCFWYENVYISKLLGEDGYVVGEYEWSGGGQKEEEEENFFFFFYLPTSLFLCLRGGGG